jgi:hypothetical protein
MGFLETELPEMPILRNPPSPGPIASQGLLPFAPGSRWAGGPHTSHQSQVACFFLPSYRASFLLPLPSSHRAAALVLPSLGQMSLDTR